MTLRRSAALVLAAAALASSAGVRAAAVTLDEAIEQALRHSALTRSAAAGARSAAEMARAASQQPDPMLNLGIENLPATGADRFNPNAEDMTMKRIGISQEWVSSDKRSARHAAAQAAHGRELSQLAVAAAEVRLQTALSYIEVYFAQQALELTKINEKVAREQLEAGKGRATTAAGSAAEVLELTAALGAAEDDSAELRQQEAVAAANLQRWTGIRAEVLSTPALPPVPEQDDFVARHPAVVARQRDVEVARQDVEVARLARSPNWSYELAYGQRQGRSDLVSFGVSIPLPIAPADRQDRETAARLAMEQKAQADLTEAQRAAAGDHAMLVGDAERLQGRIERLRRAVLEPAQMRTTAALAAYRSNQATLVMLFEARRAEVEVQRKLVSLQREWAKARAQLAFKPVAQGNAP